MAPLKQVILGPVVSNLLSRIGGHNDDFDAAICLATEVPPTRSRANDDDDATSTGEALSRRAIGPSGYVGTSGDPFANSGVNDNGSSTSSGGVSTGAIVGFVIGGVVLLALIAGLLWWHRVRIRKVLTGTANGGVVNATNQSTPPLNPPTNTMTPVIQVPQPAYLGGQTQPQLQLHPPVQSQAKTQPQAQLQAQPASQPQAQPQSQAGGVYYPVEMFPQLQGTLPPGSFVWVPVSTPPPPPPPGVQELAVNTPRVPEVEGSTPPPLNEMDGNSSPAGQGATAK
ncbi:hypothetical protein VTJ04DRAFT_3979 [Mycothermus thermophilus]|uniref:uncharacterized protein n=1 Tax=Humicola insolens TaxID=85995 RepID=UPI0037442360